MFYNDCVEQLEVYVEERQESSGFNRIHEEWEHADYIELAERHESNFAECRSELNELAGAYHEAAGDMYYERTYL